MRLDKAEALDADSTRRLYELAVKYDFRIISTVVRQRKPGDRGLRIRILDEGTDPTEDPERLFLPQEGAA